MAEFPGTRGVKNDRNSHWRWFFCGFSLDGLSNVNPEQAVAFYTETGTKTATGIVYKFCHLGIYDHVNCFQTGPSIYRLSIIMSPVGVWRLRPKWLRSFKTLTSWWVVLLLN